MDNEKFFKDLEDLLESLGDKKLPKDMKVAITYSTGETDTFDVSFKFWANAMVATKKRLKYFFYNNTLISFDHVVKMKFEGLENQR